MNLPRLLSAAAVLVALAVPSTAAATAPTEISVTLEQNLTTVNGADQGSGWSRITFNTDRPADFALVELKQGVDTGYFTNDIGQLRPDQIGRYGRWVAMGSSTPKQPYVTTIDVRPNTRYAVVVLDKVPFRPGDFLSDETLSGAEEPAAAATIDLRDFRFTAPKQLPATGALKVVNTGRQIHELAIAKIKGKPAAALKAAKAGTFGRIKMDGPPSLLVGLVSGGTTNIVEPELSPGRYLLLCGYGDKHSRNKSHATLGMAQTVTVR